jgi:hypothetical protein
VFILVVVVVIYSHLLSGWVQKLGLFSLALIGWGMAASLHCNFSPEGEVQRLDQAERDTRLSTLGILIEDKMNTVRSNRYRYQYQPISSNISFQTARNISILMSS